MIFEIINRIKFNMSADRIGPDLPFTHWKLYFPSAMKRLCKKKFGAFGENAEFRPGAYAICCTAISIGKNVVVRPNSMLFSDGEAEIILEDNVMMGAGVHIYVNNHKFERADIPLIEQGYCAAKSVVIREGAWIGANAIILPGVTIGRNAVVGAGSIVTKSIPDYSVAVGNPAKVIRKIG